jgi:hypothetical protein
MAGRYGISWQCEINSHGGTRLKISLFTKGERNYLFITFLLIFLLYCIRKHPYFITLGVMIIVHGLCILYDLYHRSFCSVRIVGNERRYHLYLSDRTEMEDQQILYIAFCIGKLGCLWPILGI